MDDDTIFGVFFVFFLLFVVSLPVTITACIAASKTRKWAKDNNRARTRAASTNTDADAENDPLAEDSEDELEVEFLDSEDEEYYVARREQKRKERAKREADLLLSTRRKFIKEWKQCWTGPYATAKERVEEQKMKEHTERRKIAREAVREYLREERKKARKTQKLQEEVSMELPTYGNAVGEKARR